MQESESSPAELSTNKKAALWVVLLSAIALLGYYDFEILRGPLASRPPSLELALQRTDTGELRLSWNPGGPALSAAEEAELVIEDGGHHSQLLLAPSQIRSGAILYAPFTQDIAFHMEAFDRDRHSTRETLRAVSTAVPQQAASAPLQPADSDYAERSAREPRDARAKPRPRAPLRAPGTVTVRATMLRDTPTAPAPKPGGFRQRMTDLGRKAARLWPFRHNEEADRPR
jgi:hypothetical protein